jgi:hypothetical protein
VEQVPLKRLAAGMVLARDVENIEGQRILAKGTALTGTRIALLTRWGVTDVMIEPPKPAPPPKEAEPRHIDDGLDLARKRLRESFQGRLANDCMKTLYTEAEKRLGSRAPWRSES